MALLKKTHLIRLGLSELLQTKIAFNGSIYGDVLKTIEIQII
ncbi:hypothetical protein ADIWIN_2974 [Winogradskyella psychrotolerans RS-3]|uniref:Uncharacterized protein n=1 Tax=Winogradskyella psychrotolerans RS-3 TaxID=641526 RepID=S7VPF8_9FLAO|nr:hypothetical protein ADIWIN_2974 [Winogradskyella psychrotolerans RS-3]